MCNSICNTLLRGRNASSKNVSIYTKFMDDCAPYMLTNLNRAACNDAAKEYYEKGVGSEGFIDSNDSTTKKIVDLALLSKTSCDKQTLFLGPVAGNTGSSEAPEAPHGGTGGVTVCVGLISKLNGVGSHRYMNC
jgi:hypothetical protein